LPEFRDDCIFHPRLDARLFLGGCIVPAEGEHAREGSNEEAEG
jgi:hypothetical protein